MEKNSTNNDHLQQTPNQTPKKKKWKKRIKNTLIGVLTGTAVLGTGYGIIDKSINNAKERKDTDKQKYGSIELANDTAKSIVTQSQNEIYLDFENGRRDTINLVEFLDDVLIKNGYNIETINPEENKDSISSMELMSTMISENTLKTDGWIFEKDQELENLGVERSKNNDESIVGKLAGHLMKSNGSYGWFQTQREAIDGYKNDEVRYTNICRKIAVFKLPNKSNKREELYKQLGYKTESGMINDLKQKKLNIYTGGNRLGIAFGIVLLNEQKIDRNKGWERFNEEEVDKRTQNIKSMKLENLDDNDPIRLALNLKGQEGENLKSIYILLNGNNKERRVSFQDIKSTLKSPEFKAGEVAAGWCTSTEAWKNGEYLLILNINELNNWFDSTKDGGNRDLDIAMPTGRFGETSTKLAIKYIKLPKEIAKKIEDGKSYKDGEIQDEIKKYLNDHPNVVEQAKDEAINEYIWNFRTFFLLNNDWSSINEKQMTFLEENLNLTFNHLYIGRQTFKKFIMNEGKSGNKRDVIKNFDNLWEEFTKDQNKESLKKIKKILTNKSEFMSFTGLSKKKYFEFIKCDLGPSILGTSIVLSETGNVVPFCQGKPKRLLEKTIGIPAGELGGLNANASNEVNSVYRFSIGAENEAIKRGMIRKGDIPIRIDEGDNSIDAIKSKIFDRCKLYIQANSRDINGDTIESANEIPDELVYAFTGLDENNIKSLEKGDSICFKTKNFKQVYRIRDNCVDFAIPGSNLSDIIYDYQKSDPTFSKILKRIIGNGKDSIEKNDITMSVIKQVVRKLDGSVWDNPGKIGGWEGFVIVYPLNKGFKSKIIEETFPKEFSDSLRIERDKKVKEYKILDEQEKKRKAEEKRKKKQYRNANNRKDHRITKNPPRNNMSTNRKTGNGRKK